MATTYTLQELMDSRSAKGTQSNVTYARTYRVLVTDSVTGKPVRVTEAAVYAYAIAPVSPGPGAGFTIGSNHPVDTGAVITAVDVADEAADGCDWLINVAWQRNLGTSGGLTDAPLSRPAECTWSTSAETIEVYKDVDGNLIQASNGTLFDKQPTRERGMLTLQYVKNYSVSAFRTTILPAMAYDYVINSASFTIDGVSIPARVALLEVTNAPRTIENGTTFYRVTFTLSFRQYSDPDYATDGWRERYLDRSRFEWDGSDLVPLLDKQGQPVEVGWPLDGAGAALPNATDAPAVLGPFKLYPEISFTPFGFT